MEKINLVELLKDCPQGMELDCTMYDNLYFDSLNADYYGTINCYTLIDGIKTSINFTKYGTFNNHIGAKCVIFPKGKTTWEGFVPPCEFKKESEDDERMWKLIKKYVHYNISDMALNADHITREQLESWLEEQDKKELMNFDEAEKEKTDFVGDGFIECHADFLDFKEGDTYWLEYIGDDKYNVRSDNLLGKTYHITPYQLYTIFKKLTWLEKQDIFSKKDVDDAYLKGVTDTKNEIEKQYEANYQIRKDIATFLFNYKGDIKDRSKWMNYLGVFFVEKQGEKPQGKSALEAVKEEKVDNQNCVKSIDKVEPKFKVGKWIVNNISKDVFLIKSINSGYYSLEDIKGNTIFPCLPPRESESHLWTIQDAKDGDVLAFDNDTIVIFKDLYNSTSFHSYCHIEDGMFDFNKDMLPDWWEGEGFKPATKEQRDLLFSKMKKAGYEWDAENKTLEKIVPKFKVGDIIRHKNGYSLDVSILKINADCYTVKDFMGDQITIDFTHQDNYELVPNKFDINTLVPFESKVLGRDNNQQKWYPAIWGYYDDNSRYPYAVIGDRFKYCIPYKNNEHLLGTTNDCNDFYKTW